MTVAVLLQQQQITANPLQSRNHAAVAPNTSPSPAESAAVATELTSPASHLELNVRLRKRRSGWHELYAREMSSHEVEWANSCRGEWQHVSAPRRRPIKKILRMLQNSTGKEQKTIRINATVIDISDIGMWSWRHKETYRFLPVLKLNSNVALRRWHRQMQLYVASFAYMRRAHLIWDHSKLQHESAISKELFKLKLSSRSILCEIETAINNTPSSLSSASAVSSMQRHATSHHKRHLQHLTFLSRDAMEKRLRFQTNLKQLYGNSDHNPHLRQGHVAADDDDDKSLIQEVHPIDLKFVKYRYFGYLRAMLKILRSHTRRLPGQRLRSTTAAPLRTHMENISSKSNSIKNGRRRRNRKSKIHRLQKEKERRREEEREKHEEGNSIQSRVEDVH